MAASLTWGLLICTYKREQVLRRAVKLALEQSRPPAEVIIVDTSPDWQDARQRFVDEIVPQLGDIPWEYKTSPRNALPYKRNIAIDSSKCDVVFMIDDDSLLFPGAAEAVMQVYEADVRGEVAGVTMVEEDAPPNASAEEQRVAGDKPKPTGWLGHLERALSEQKLRFMPYDGRYHQRNLPETLRGLNVVPVALLGGFRMTFRREVIARVRFPEYLEGYAVGEDFDASYRASRLGALVLACSARVHHLVVPGGRPNRPMKTSFTCLNVIAMYALNAPNGAPVWFNCNKFLAQRLGIALATDVGRRRFDFPDTRGMLFAWRHMGEVLKRRGRDLEEWHLAFQRQHLSA